MVASVHRLRANDADGDTAVSSDGDVSLVAAVRRREPAAAAMLYDRHAAYVERVLVRVLGLDGELEDALHDVFVEALASIDRLRDAAALRPWLARIAVFTARGLIRRRRRRRWLAFLPGYEVEEIGREPADDDVGAVVQRVYALLDGMDPDLRIPLCLRRFEDMSLVEIAAACDVSLATVKRRLVRAEAELMARARRDALVAEWLASHLGGEP